METLVTVNIGNQRSATPPAIAPAPTRQAALADAAARVPGGTAALIGASARHLAAALEVAGFRVVRDVAPSAQLTL